MMVIIAIALVIIAAAYFPFAITVLGDILRWVGRVLWYLYLSICVIATGIYLFA